MNAVAQEMILKADQPITEFNEFKAQLAELKALNDSVVFNYEDPKGNKEARSHLYKLRQTKSAVEKTRKEVKGIALEYGRKVDSAAKEISTEIEQMIETHEKPIKEIEEREAARVSKCKQLINDIKECGVVRMDQDSDSIRKQINNLVSLQPTKEDTQEFFVEAMQEYKLSKQSLASSLDHVIKQEEQQAELDRLQKEAEERKQKERDAQIAREAEERAKREAEEKAKAEKERLIREKEEAEQREIEAKKAVEEAAQKAKEQAEREQQEKEEQERLEAEQRQRDIEHKSRIDTAIAKRLVEHAGPLPGNAPQKIIYAINTGKIPNIKIEY